MEGDGTGLEVRKGANIYKHLLCVGNGARSFACIVSVNPETNLHKLASFYRCANWSSEKLEAFPKILMQGRSRVWILDFFTPGLNLFQLHPYNFPQVYIRQLLCPAQYQACAISSPKKTHKKGTDSISMNRAPSHLCFGNTPLSAMQRLDLKGVRTVAAASFKAWLSRGREMTLQPL